MVNQPVNQKVQKVLNRFILFVKVLAYTIYIKLQQAFFKFAMVCDMSIDMFIVDALHIGLFMGKMSSGIINQLGNQSCQAVCLI